MTSEFNRFARTFEIITTHDKSKAKVFEISIYDPQSNSFQPFIIDVADENNAIAELTEAFDNLPINTQIRVSRGIGFEFFIKNENGDWIQQEKVTPGLAPATPAKFQ